MLCHDRQFLLFRCVRVWAELLWVARYYKFEQAYRVRIVKNECIVSMLECTLHFLNVIGTAADVNLRVLRILDAEAIA